MEFVDYQISTVVTLPEFGGLPLWGKAGLAAVAWYFLAGLVVGSGPVRRRLEAFAARPRGDHWTPADDLRVLGRPEVAWALSPLYAVGLAGHGTAVGLAKAAHLGLWAFTLGRVFGPPWGRRSADSATTTAGTSLAADWRKTYADLRASVEKIAGTPPAGPAPDDGPARVALADYVTVRGHVFPPVNSTSELGPVREFRIHPYAVTGAADWPYHPARVLLLLDTGRMVVEGESPDAVLRLFDKASRA